MNQELMMKKIDDAEATINTMIDQLENAVLTSLVVSSEEE
tara:strand:+ start:252 stop:371 length:120 start_codon:yes stop_codon:yes gene_type:complete